MRLFKKYLGLLTTLFLSFSLMIGYAWWDQLQEELDSIEIQVGYGSRIQLNDITPFAQGELVPSNSPLASLQGYTSEYTLAFEIQFSPNIVLFDLVLEIQDIRIEKNQQTTAYNGNAVGFSSLIIAIQSFDQSINFFPSNPYRILGNQTLFNFDETRMTTPLSRFEVVASFDEGLVDQNAYNLLAGASIFFDLFVEVFPES